ATDLFVDLLTTSLKPDEVITSIRIPIPAAGSGAAYQKFPHPASRYAITGVAAVVRLNADATCASAAVGVTGARPKPTPPPSRAAPGAQARAGSKLAAAALAKAGSAAGEAVDAGGDIHASAEYRRHLVNELAQRAVRAATGRARK